MTDKPSDLPLIACHDCDALYRKVPLAPGQKARCPRCGAVLYRRSRLAPDQVLALVIAALLTLAIANATPIVGLNVQGAESSATLIGSIGALWSEGRIAVATLAALTTLVFPTAELAALGTVLVLVRRRPRSSLVAPLLRGILAVRPWGMIEVFMLGVLVALVKLSHMARVLPGTALWAFAALTVLMAAILSFDLDSLWDEWSPP